MASQQTVRGGLAAEDIAGLERLGVLTWPAEDIREMDGWLWCLDRGVTRRANCVLPLAGDPVRRLDAPIMAVETAFERHGLAACFKITAACPLPLDHVLARRGYGAEGQSLVLTGPGDAMAKAPAGHPVEFADWPDGDWASACWPGPDRSARQAIAARIPPPRCFAAIRLDGTIAGTGLAAVAGDWAMLTALRTVPRYRRRGVGRSLVGALIGWAFAQGARRACLQVEAANRPARRLYAAAGFRVAYAYHYRSRPGPVDADNPARRQ